MFLVEGNESLKDKNREAFSIRLIETEVQLWFYRRVIWAQHQMTDY